MSDTQTQLFRRIGTAKFNRLQVYTLDPLTAHNDNVNTVVVPEGQECEVLSDGFTTIIRLEGTLNVGRIFRIGDGAFSSTAFDIPSNIDVVVPSRSFGPDEWEAILKDTNVAWSFEAGA